jgi:hypothetical protein
MSFLNLAAPEGKVVLIRLQVAKPQSNFVTKQATHGLEEERSQSGCERSSRRAQSWKTSLYPRNAVNAENLRYFLPNQSNLHPAKSTVIEPWENWLSLNCRSLYYFLAINNFPVFNLLYSLQAPFQNFSKALLVHLSSDH